MIVDKDGIYRYAASVMDSRGRITLPQVVRKQLGIHPGRRFTFTLNSSGSLLLSVAPEGDLASREVEYVGVPSKGESPLVIDTTTELVRKGHLVSVSDFQELMGWPTRQTVRTAVVSNRVFVMVLDEQWYLPAFFADPAYERAHLEAVTKALGALPGGAKMQFFLSRKGSLRGRTVLQAIASGKLDQVLRLAAAYAEG